MAKAKVIKSRKGNDLVQLTLGPRETGKVLAAIGQVLNDEHLDGVFVALEQAQAATRNAKQFEAETTFSIV